MQTRSYAKKLSKRSLSSARKDARLGNFSPETVAKELAVYLAPVVREFAIVTCFL